MPDEHDLQRPESENGPAEQPTPESESVYHTEDYMLSEFADEDFQPITTITEPVDDDETADLPAVSVEAADTDASADAAETADPHESPTVPLPEEGEDEAKRTLAGSGGLDPNPDFISRESEPPRQLDHTVPHIVPFQHTMVHVPPEQGSQQPNPFNAPTAYTAQAQRYQGVPSAPPAQQYTQPSPYGPGYGAPPPRAPQQGQNLPRRKAKRRTFLGCSPGCAMIFVGLFVTFCGGLTLITLVLTATLGTRLEEQLQAQVAGIDTYRNFESTFYYDRTGQLLYEAFGEGRRTNVRYEDFPQDLINATVAVEDDSFWSNPGIEMQATTRAFLQYVGLAEGESGGSTITQQLVRNVLFDFEYRAERSVQRKVEEILLALLLNNRKPKEEILELYLNEIYYGNLAYGAEAAAQTFFGKSVGELTLGEAALLAGLPQAPANLDPLNPDPAVQEAVNQRWRLVLDRMVAERFITNDQRNQALSEGLRYVQPEAPLRAPHFTVFAQQELEQLMSDLGYAPEDVARGGLQVYTTVDLDINTMAQNAARSQVAGLTANNVTNAAVLVLKPGTGEILAMVGSVDYNNEAIDGRVNVTTSPRQPGSTMKPFTYSAAMELGFTPADVIWDTPTDIAGYQPVNYDRTFHGPVRMRSALGNSYNIPAVQTLRQVGVEYLLSFMSRFGVASLGTDASRYGLSLTLGGGEVTLLELTRGYSVFANGGVLVPTTSILCVLDGEDNILYEYENGCPRGNPTDNTVSAAGYGRQVLDPRIAYIITDILGDNVARTPAMGANSPLNTGNLAASVKTGTTDDFKDNWTVGYTRNVAVGVWVGNSNGDPMVNTSGLTGAAPIWNDVIEAIYNNNDMLGELRVEGNLQPDRFDPPPGISQRALCNLDSLRDPATECPAQVSEWMLDGPAGIPDGNGGLQFPPQQPAQQNQPPATGPWLQEVEPDIYRVLVQPIPPDIAQQIQFAPGGGQPLPPLYCQVPVELAGSAVGARDQLFIGPPPVPEDARQAEQYARNQGLAFLPPIACDATLVSLGPGGTGGSPAVITALITSPTPGQVVTDNMPIIGTAQFGSDQALYYKIEISGGQFGDNWVTLGETHSSSVVNGQLEFLQAAGLQPGNYQIRLAVVGLDGNYVQTPYTVPFTRQ